MTHSAALTDASPARTAGLAGTSLCDVLDRLLSTGVVLQGELVISVADVDLLYAGINLVLASTDTMRRFGRRG